MEDPISKSDILTILSNQTYLTSTLKRDELINRLKKISSLLSLVDENDKNIKVMMGKKNCFKDIVLADYLFKSKSDEIKILIACCIADILRITAPNPPYTSNQLSSIFKLFIEQFKDLANSNNITFKRSFYLLECLAVVRTYLILNDKNIDDGIDILCNMFKLFFTISSKNLVSRVEFYFKEMICVCIDEFDDIPVRLIHIILENLIPPTSKDNPKAFEMACDIIRKSSHKLEHPISMFLTESFITRKKLVELDKPKTKSKYNKTYEDEDSDIDHNIDMKTDIEETLFTDGSNLYALVLELANLVPSTLLQLMPQIQDFLTIENEKERIELVNTLGTMFTNDANLGRDYNLLLASFFKRLVDRSAAVRLAIVSFGKKLIQHYHSNESLIDYLCSRLEDADEVVRFKASEVIGEALLEFPDLVPTVLIQKLGSRMCDKSDNIVRNVAEVLCKLFRQNCLEYWRTGLEMPASSRKYLFIPKKLSVLLSHDISRRLMYEEFLEEILLDRKLTMEERTRCFIGFYASLDEKMKEALNTILIKNKHRAQLCIRELIAMRNNKNEHAADSDFMIRRNKFADQMLSCIFGREVDDNKISKRDLLYLMIDHNDNNVAKFFNICCNPLSHRSDLLGAKKELIRIASVQTGLNETSKNMLKKLVFRLTIFLPMTLISVDSVNFIFNEILSSWKAEQEILCCAAFSLIHSLSIEFPTIFTGYFPRFLELFSNPIASDFDNGRLVESLLIFAHITGFKDVTECAAVSNIAEYVKVLSQFLLTGTFSQAAAAVSCLHHLLSPGHKSHEVLNNKSVIPLTKKCSDFFTKIIDELVGGINLPISKYPNIGACISSLGSIAFEMSEYVSVSPKIDIKYLISFVLQQLLPSPLDQEFIKEICNAKIAGIKFLINLIASKNEVAKAHIQIIYKFFFKIIENQGFLTTEEVKDESTQDEVFISVISGLLQLSSSSEIEKILQPVHFNTLCYAAHANSHQVRKSFILRASELLKANRIPFRYAAILTLAATEPDLEIKDVAKISLEQLVISQRRIAANWQAKNNKTPPSHILPEYFLADLIHVLAHHPDLNMENRTEEQTLLYFAKFLNFYIDALLKEHTAHHLTFIYELLISVRNAFDATEIDNMKPNTFYLAELGLLVHNQKIKGRGNKIDAKNYPITLDPLMYFNSIDKPTSKTFVLPSSFKLAAEKKPEGVLSPEVKKALASPRPKEIEKKDRQVKSKASKKLQLNEGSDNDSEDDETDIVPAKPIKPATAPTRQLPGRRARSTAEQALKTQLGEDTAHELMDEEMEFYTTSRKAQVSPKQEKSVHVTKSSSSTKAELSIDSVKKINNIKVSTPVKSESPASTPKRKNTRQTNENSLDLFEALVENDNKESVIELVNKKKKVNPHAKNTTYNKMDSEELKLASPRARYVSGPPSSPPTRSRSASNK